MTKAIFGFPRSPFYTLSGGSWGALYPLTNLQSLPLSRVARSTDAITTSTIIDGNVNPGISSIAGMIALARHNLSDSAQIRLTTWFDASRTFQTFSGAFEPVYPSGYSRRISDVPDAVFTWYKRFNSAGSSGTLVGSFRLEISDATNPDGYVEAGFLEIAQVFEVRYNFQFGFQYGFNWRSVVSEAVGGAEYIDRRAKPRVVRGVFPYTLRAESMAMHYEMQRQFDYDVPFLFVPLPDETAHFPRTVFLARQMDPGLITIATRGAGSLLDSVPFALREIIG